jgi:hypothetical protein
MTGAVACAVAMSSSLALDADSLANVLTALGPPAFVEASCAVDGERLVVKLVGVRSGLELFGRPIGMVDAELFLSADRAGPRTIALAWEFGRIGGLPGGLLGLVSHAKLVRPLLGRLLQRLRVGAAVELDDQGAHIHLDRLPGRGGVMRQVRCDRFAIPGGRALALTASFVVEESEGPRSGSAPAPRRVRAR